MDLLDADKKFLFDNFSFPNFHFLTRHKFEKYSHRNAYKNIILFRKIRQSDWLRKLILHCHVFHFFHQLIKNNRCDRNEHSLEK